MSEELTESERVKFEIKVVERRYAQSLDKFSRTSNEYSLGLETLIELKKIRLAILETAALNIE
jgi:hypothetical protein